MRANELILWALVATMASAIVALAVNAQLAFFIALFGIVGWWAWQQPVQALYMLIVLAPLLPMFKITQTIGNFTLIKDVLIVVLFMKLFGRPLLVQQLPYRRNILAAPIMTLIIWVGVSVLRADSFILGVLRARDIFLYILLYFAVLYLPFSKRIYREAAKWFLINAFIVTVMGWYQYFFVPDSAVLRFDPAQQAWIPRVSSVMAHPSILGQYLVAVSTLLVSILLTAARYRLIILMSLGLLLPLVYLTYSRAVWLGYIVSTAAVLAANFASRAHQWRGRRITWKAWGLGLAFFPVLVLVAMELTSAGVFIRSAFDPTYASNAERLVFLARLIAPMTSAEALLGRGLGDVLQQNFRLTDVSAADIASGASRSIQMAKNLTLVDNQYLKTFVEMGLAGILIYIWLHWRIVRAVLKIANDELKNATAIGLWALGFMVSFVFQAFFIDIWDIFPTNAVWWIIAALVSRATLTMKTKTAKHVVKHKNHA